MSSTRIACLLPLALLLSPIALAQVQPSPLLPDATLLQVNAHGEAHRTPDVAALSAGVVTQHAEASVAMHENADRMAAVVAALRKAGVADRDIQTSQLELSPQYNANDNQAPRITGYQVSNTVHIRLREMARIGEVLDLLVRQGANQIEGPSFSVDKPEATLDEARRDAIHNAQAHAETYAAAAGLRVRRIVTISESGGWTGQPRQFLTMANTVAKSTPVAAGENTLSVDLDVAFELGR